MRTSEEYRRLADQCERVASVLSDGAARDKLQVEAEQHRQMAEMLDARVKSKNSQSE